MPAIRHLLSDCSGPNATLSLRRMTILPRCCCKQGLLKRQIDVPRQIRVLSFDDVGFATLVSPALTTIHQPCRDIAVCAFQAMVERLNDPTLPARHITVAPRLVVRDSCGAYL